MSLGELLQPKLPLSILNQKENEVLQECTKRQIHYYHTRFAEAPIGIAGRGGW